jgi:glycine hydroxymethyltransferase
MPLRSHSSTTEIADVLAKELRRQQSTLEMIASENFVPQAVLDCRGSLLTKQVRRW